MIGSIPIKEKKKTHIIFGRVLTHMAIPGELEEDSERTESEMENDCGRDTVDR